MKKLRVIPVCLYWIGVVLIVSSIVLRKEEDSLYLFWFGLLIVSIQGFFGKTKVYNLSGKPIYKKDEDSNNVTAVPAFRSADHLDGVGLPESGKVVRVCESTSLICLPGGHYIYAGPVNWALNMLWGGKNSNTAPDDNWKPLFDKVEKGGN